MDESISGPLVKHMQQSERFNIILRKYGKFNRSRNDFSSDDVESAFWLGVTKALNRGCQDENLLFVSGELQIRQEVHVFRREQHFLFCDQCHKEYGTTDGISTCSTCQGELKELSRCIPLENMLDYLPSEESDGAREGMMLQSELAEFSEQLPPKQQRVWRLLEQGHTPREVAKLLPDDVQHVYACIKVLKTKLSSFRKKNK